MRKLVALVVAFGTLVVVPAYAAHTPTTTAEATQHPVNQSGVVGRIDFTAVGGGTAATGTATGLQPLAPLFRYISLVYDVHSVSGGPTACEPTEELDGMFVGTWVVDASGNGTLMQLAPPSAVAPIGTFDTVSIRDTTINGGFGVEAVVACGQVSVHTGG
jgi:hypothetical protein